MNINRMIYGRVSYLKVTESVYNGKSDDLRRSKSKISQYGSYRNGYNSGMFQIN